jgi:hypothetical protein
MIREAKEQAPASKRVQGAVIWLVPTYNGIEEWKPIARRCLTDVEWSWET